MKINVIGCTGCGKSTFSKYLAKNNNLKLISIDKIKYKPNWIEEKIEIFEKKLLLELCEDNFVIDGLGNTKSLAIRSNFLDEIIFLDFPLSFCEKNIIKRVKSNIAINDLPVGCEYRNNEIGSIKIANNFQNTIMPKLYNIFEEINKKCNIIIYKNIKDLYSKYNDYESFIINKEKNQTADN